METGIVMVQSKFEGIQQGFPVPMGVNWECPARSGREIVYPISWILVKKHMYTLQMYI